MGLDRLIKDVKAELDAIKQRDPAARGSFEILVTYPGIHCILAHRLAHSLYLSRHYLLARTISQISRFFTGIEIHPGASIGKGLFIDHGMGVVIGETAIVGDNCTIYQGVTLGGTGKHKGKRHPTLGNDVLVGAGAKILGPFKVGNGAKIAAGAVVLEAVPDGCTAVGVPARIVRRNGVKVNKDMDHVHIPDPVAQELCRMNMRVERLEKGLGVEPSTADIQAMRIHCCGSRRNKT